MNNIWKQPARLWRRREPLVAGAELPARQIASGSLEDMIRRALARAAETGPTEGQALFIDVGAPEVLAWSAISKLSRSPSFPVEI